LQGEGALGSYEAAARLLPSVATQEARRATLPTREELAQRLDQARTDLPFRPEAFDPFLDTVAASRTLPALRPADLAGTPIAARLEPLLMQRGGEWHGPIVLQDVRDPERVRAATEAFPGEIVPIDMHSELGTILSGYTARAWKWLGWSGLMVVLVLAAGLRDPVMILRVIGSVLAASVVTASVLTLFGLRLSLIHLVALQLVAGVGLDYALFFARRQLDGEERARTLRTLVTCNAMTLLTFGLLALCQTPLLRDIGITVASGSVLALGFAFFATGEAPGAA
jgi:predicted exporter